MPPNCARKSSHGAPVMPNTFPATTPARISMIATESANSTAIALAAKTSSASSVATVSVSMEPPEWGGRRNRTTPTAVVA